MTSLYAGHFDLTAAPFSIAPNPRFLFMSAQHREALAHLLYGIDNDGGFVLLTGEVGTGKTTLCRCLLEKIPDDTDVAFIINPRLSVVDLLANICDELGIPYAEGELSNRLLVDAINAYLLEHYAQGRKTVLIIDEAQNLDTDVLEQLRLLTNLETDERKLLQIILLGQPELQEKLGRAELRQLAQRITARYHLQALNPQDMQAYISHRLAIAGCDKRIFTPAALRNIYARGKGIPRLTNLICDRSMLGAFAGGVWRIGRGIVRQAAKEVLGEQVHGHYAPRSRKALLWAFACLLLVATALLISGQQGLFPMQTQHPVQASQSGTQPAVNPTIYTAAAQTGEVVYADGQVLSGETKPADQPDESTPIGPASEASQGTVPVITSELWQWPADADTRRSRHIAFTALFSAWGIALPEGVEPCSFASARGLSCLQQTGDLGRLRSLNRPAVLAWQTDSGDIAHITILSMRGATASAQAAGKQVELPLEQLRQHWLDRFTILWRTPDAYSGDVLPGTAGPSARWLNGRLIELDSSSPASSTADAAKQDKAGGHIPGIYEGQWVHRLRRFQRDAGLLPDGAAGPQTLIRLNTALHEAGPRLINPPSQAQSTQAASTQTVNP
ncbi:MAG: AAA family ATPase [Mariprofundaceae bacterium]|nr:AAA family ATPase [Mariprofundaceae bacterium]